MPVPDFVVTPELVASNHIQQDEYYEVYPLLIAYQKIVAYFEVFSHIRHLQKDRFALQLDRRWF